MISGDVADPNLLFRLRFRLDNYRLVYKTFCNTLVDWISKMGGLLTAFLGFFTLLSFQLSEVLLLSSILDSLFFIRKDPSSDKVKAVRRRTIHKKRKQKVFPTSTQETEHSFCSDE